MRPMRRADREVTDFSRIVEVMKGCKVARLGMYDEVPYIVPLNFGYDAEDGSITLYFHSAKVGRKMDILAKNPTVCFEMDREMGLVPSENPCAYGYGFESIIGTGKVEFIEDTDAKIYALNRIMLHQAGIEVPFTEAQVMNLCVYKVKADEFACKIRKMG